MVTEAQYWPGAKPKILGSIDVVAVRPFRMGAWLVWVKEVANNVRGVNTGMPPSARHRMA